MKNEDEWKEIEENMQNREEKVKEKYGFDITKKFEESLNKENVQKRKQRNLILKIISIIIIIILLSIFIYNMNADLSNIEILKMIDYHTENGFEYISSDTNFFGNGFFAYKSKDNEEIEIHCLFDKTEGICKHDIDARYYKYYFKKWEDVDKDKFVVIENYEEAKCGLRKKKDWFLNFETYIEAHTYEDMLYATEAIIRFIEYMGNRNLLVKSYIKIDDKKILPHNVSGQTNDQIRKMVNDLYNNYIIEEN